jgi:predicted 3-demethylubiquinone-9 3-methyltransferase (glyoxalase superfamily)
MSKITPFLWFDDRAEEAARFYTSIFRKSKIRKVVHYADAAAKASGRPAGSVMTIEFQIEGQKFIALNGGPYFKFTEAVSFVVHCRTQAEVDRFWTKLSSGGRQGQCGWLKDKFGLSWQVIPDILVDLLDSADAAKTQRVMEALLCMRKIDIKKLKRSFAESGH